MRPSVRPSFRARRAPVRPVWTCADPPFRRRRRTPATVASIGKIASPAQGAGFFERDGYDARDDGAHRAAGARAGKGAAGPGLSGPVDPQAFRRVLEDEFPGGRRLGRREIGGEIVHRPGRDVTPSAPKSVSPMAMAGGDDRIAEPHDRAVGAMPGRIGKNAFETRMRDPGSGPGQAPATGAMVRACDRKTVAGHLPPRHV